MCVPSLTHEGLIELFRERPQMAVDLLRTLVTELPDFDDVQINSSDLGTPVPAEYRADLVLLLVDDKPVFAIVIEAQLSIEKKKLLSWPVYVTRIHARFGCPGCVFVVAPKSKVAAWAAKPIPLGPGSMVTPLVLGPGGIPVVTDPALAAAEPELAVLSAMAHLNDPESGFEVLKTAVEATRGLDDSVSVLYWKMMAAAANEATKRALKLLKFADGSDFPSELTAKERAALEAKGEAKGRTEGKAESVLDVLAARGLEVSSAQRQTVLDCNDSDRLGRWLKVALSATTAAEVLTVK